MKLKGINFLKTQRGQGLTEYAMILVMICLACIVVLGSLGQILVNTYYTLINDAFPG